MASSDLSDVPRFAAAPLTAATVYRGLMSQFVRGVIFPGVITIALCFLCLEMSWQQCYDLLPLIPPGVALYSLPEAWLVHRLYRPMGTALAWFDRGQRPPEKVISAALARTLNMPYYAFLRVTLVRGPLASVSAVLALLIGNWVWHCGFQTWQILMFPALVLLFACPAYAMIEYFNVSRHLVPLVERFWQHCTHLEIADQRALIAVRLKSKLLYLCIFITALPLLFVAFSVLFKVHLLLRGLGVSDTMLMMWPLLRWIIGALAVCIIGALVVSVMTAQEVSRSAARLIGGMNEVERGNLDVDLKVLGTDEYADLTRGFNLMTDGLREEVRILEVSQDLSGELQLDVLIGRIMKAACELLDADRSTLFVYDAQRNQLWSRFGMGLQAREIRIAADAGIAGYVFSSGQSENITDAYADPRFSAEIDNQTGYRTHTILCMPIVNKTGKRIGVTQVLNKHGGCFNARDEQRLRAFTAQIAVTLENAQLFDEVLAVKNYNENILASTTDGVVTLDQQQRVVTANGAALNILGLYGAEQLAGRPAQELFSGDNAWVLRSIDKVIASGLSDAAVDAVFVRPDGGEASVNLTAAPLKDAQAQRIGLILNFEDFTSEKRVKSTMARYMSQEVADQLLAAGESVLGGKLQKASILFSDLRGFTTVSETLGARETVSMLNQYFEQMVEVIFNHHGILDKYIGDAIMAVFGSPFAGPRDADNAVATANGMLSALAQFNRRRTDVGQKPLDIGIGIATGDVIVGNIGSPRRMEYTVIGDDVNLASRLESATKQYGVRVLLSEATVAALHTPILMRQIDCIRVKGQDRAVTVYEALGYHDEHSFPDLPECLKAYASGLEAYRARAWKRAQDAFSAVLACNPQDRPSQIYLQRCQHYAGQPPPPDWDYVWRLQEK